MEKVQRFVMYMFWKVFCVEGVRFYSLDMSLAIEGFLQRADRNGMGRTKDHWKLKFKLSEH